MDIDGPVAAVVIIAPDFIEQGLTGKDPAAVGSEEHQEPVFCEGEVEGVARKCRLPAHEVDHQIVVADHVLAVDGICLLEELFNPEGSSIALGSMTKSSTAKRMSVPLSMASLDMRASMGIGLSRLSSLTASMMREAVRGSSRERMTRSATQTWGRTRVTI